MERYNLQRAAAQMNMAHRLRRRRKRVMGLLSVIMATVTLYTLLLPAFTLEKETTCGFTEHVHTDACYASELVCPFPEEGHTHNRDCYDADGMLICALQECAWHVHSDECWERKLVCGLPEHVHTDACYANAGADKENAAVWEHTLPDVSGMAPVKALTAIAKSQLGYRESFRNFVVNEAGEILNYSRYGEWYGLPYENWSAMFVSFCLHYAGIDTAVMPQDADGARMQEVLVGEGRFVSSPLPFDFKPLPGDLVFLSDPVTGAVRVGILAGFDTGSGFLSVIEGDVNGEVLQNSYYIMDNAIIGLGLLPEELRAAAAEKEAFTPAAEFTDSTEKVSVRVEAPEGAFPEGTTMLVRTVPASLVMDAVTEVVDAPISRVDAVDISFWYENQEIEPAQPIRVFMQPIEAVRGPEPVVVHVEDNGTAAPVETVPSDGAAEAVCFETESFSVYALVYTVDFSWEVNGKTYEFSLRGGDYISFETLASALGIVTDPEDVSAFVAEVEDLTFTDPSLVWVGKIDADTTLGELKALYGLEIEYSAELTEEEIAQIDAQPVHVGDWVLISLRPFDTEETLTVTMKNGDVFKINVTDAAYTGTSTTSLNGKTGALVNVTNGNALQDTPLDANHLQAVAVTVNNNVIATNPSNAVLTEWTFTRATSANQYYISSPNGYLNISSSGLSVVSGQPQALRVETKDDGTIRIRHASSNYNVNNTGNSTSNGYGSYESNWDSNPGEWFTFYQLSDPPHVTVHYVDRNGNPLTGIQYTPSDIGADVTANADGTFTIPYINHGSIDLRADFNFDSVNNVNLDVYNAKYTYGSTHLDGKDASGDNLMHEGYIIDSVLTSNNNDLQFRSDSGYTWIPSNNPNNLVMGNLNYGQLTSYSLSGRVYNQPTDNGSTLPYVLSNNKDIYVILDPLPTIDSQGGNDNPVDAQDPTLEKDMKENGDGTYDLSLTVKAHAKSVDDHSKANVLFVVDTSSSMRYTTTSNSRNRIMDTHDAVMALGQELLEFNQLYSDAIEVSMIAFDGGVNERLDWTSDPDEFNTAVNEYLRYYYLHTGTDWEDAMKEALKKVLEKKQDDDDPTYVIFFTDGEPSQYTNFHGAGTNSNPDPTTSTHPANEREQISGSYSNFYSYFLCRESSKDEMRALVDADALLYGVYAYNPPPQQQNPPLNPYNGYNGPEGGTEMLHNAIRYGYNTDADLEGSVYFHAEDTEALEAAFEKILKSITNSVGFSNVIVTDGITTGVTSSTVVDGDVTGFTYTIRDQNDALDYQVTVAPIGVPNGTTAADGTPIFTLSDNSVHVGETRSIAVERIKKDGSGNPVLNNNGKLQTETVNVDVYYLSYGGREYVMPIAEPGNTVTWDLTPLGILKDGYTYDLTFVVWPNQEAYDLVADLNNGKRPDLESSANWNEAAHPYYTDASGRRYQIGGIPEYPYIALYEDGTYAVMSNTDQTIEYYKEEKTIINNQPVTEYEGPNVTPADPPDPMRLIATKSQLEKQWNVDRNPDIMAELLYGDDPLTIPFSIQVRNEQTGQYETYKGPINLGWDPNANDGEGAYVWDETSPSVIGKTYDEQGVATEHEMYTRWASDFSIASGLMLSDEQMDARRIHKNEEKYARVEFEGTTYYILEKGHDYKISEDIDIGYEFDFINPEYHPMLVDNVLMNVEFDDNGQVTAMTPIAIDEFTGLSALKVENTLRGYLHVNKVVVDKNNNPVTSDNARFEYTVTVEDEEGRFVGEHIPWYGISGLFYHDAHDNYYQAYPSSGSSLILYKEIGGDPIYATCDNGQAFDQNAAGPTAITITDTGEQIQLYGNVMEVVSGSENTIITAEILLSQADTLNIANIPDGSTYTVVETQKEGYDLVNIVWDPIPGVEDEPVITLSDGKIEGSIVTNRDNHVTYTNKQAPGALALKKLVDVNGSPASTEAQYALVDHDYFFTIARISDTDPSVSTVIKYVQITVTQGEAVSYKIADTADGLAEADSHDIETGGWALLNDLVPGDYRVTETDERYGLLLSDITRADGDTDAVNTENSSVTLHVTREKDTLASLLDDAKGTFTNSYYSNESGSIALDVVKEFVGLNFKEDVPADFNLVISYELNGEQHYFDLVAGAYGHDQNERVYAYRLVNGEKEFINGETIMINESRDEDGFTLSWHVSGINRSATNFLIHEANYGSIPGYTFKFAAFNGSTIEAPDTPDQDRALSVTASAASLTSVESHNTNNAQPDTHTFTLADDSVLLVKQRTGGTTPTYVISRYSLNPAAKAAIEAGLPNTFRSSNILYYSMEDYPDGFSHNGNRISVTFGSDENGNATAECTVRMRAYESLYQVVNGFPNNAEYTNTYQEITATLQLVKVDVRDMVLPLEGAQFTLKRLDPEDEGLYLTGDSALTLTSNVTGSDGIATITDIPEGYYEISETAVPEHYILNSDGKFYIRVHNGAITRIAKCETDDPETTELNEKLVKNWPVIADDSTENNIIFVNRTPAVADDPSTPEDESAESVTTYKVGNTPGTELPHSGGAGTTMFMLFGMVLTAAALILLAWKSRRSPTPVVTPPGSGPNRPDGRKRYRKPPKNTERGDARL